MDVKRAIRLAVNTGETTFGVKEASKEIEEGNAKMLVVADNCPEKKYKKDEIQGVPIYHFDGNNHELGSAAGKPFTASVITIIEQGNSNILSLGE
ncbi:MAG: 50S ribosomal protein L30e [Thermoplasmatota archaeon]